MTLLNESSLIQLGVSVDAAARSLRETAHALIVATTDADHQVRAQAATAMGCFLPFHWRTFAEVAVRDFFGVSLSGGRGGGRGEDSEDAGKTVRDLLVERLVVGSRDKVGEG